MTKIKEHLHNLIWKIRRHFTRRTVLKKLIKYYEEQYETELLMEEWIIKRILDGQKERRKELQEKQAKIKEIEQYLDFFYLKLKKK